MPFGASERRSKRVDTFNEHGINAFLHCRSVQTVPVSLKSGDLRFCDGRGKYLSEFIGELGAHCGA